MRIGVSGTHGTGKSTLVEEVCARLGGHESVDEPYVLLEEEGHELGHPPSAADFRRQLDRSLVALGVPAARVVFDRTPLDFLAYLAVMGVDRASEAGAVRAALATLDLLVLVPVTPEAERLLPPAELPELRRAVDDALLDLVHTDSLEVVGGLPVLELTGPLAGRVDAVVRACRPAAGRRSALR
jgi:hypothetical protein